MLRRVAAFCQPLQPVLLLVSFPRSRSPVVGVPGAVLEVAGCAVCASAAPNSWRIEVVLVVAGVVPPLPVSQCLSCDPVLLTDGICLSEEGGGGAKGGGGWCSREGWPRTIRR